MKARRYLPAVFCIALIASLRGRALADSTFCYCLAASNLLANASIEDGQGRTNITGWLFATNWGAREDTDAYGFTGPAMQDGDYAYKGWNDVSHCYQSNIPVIGARTYSAHGYFYHSSTEDVIANSPTSTRMFIHIEWFATNGLLLGEQVSSNHNGTSPADVWTQIAFDVTSPSNAATATFHIETDRDTPTWGSVFGDAFHFGEMWHPGVGWQGRVLADGETLDHWSVEYETGATATLHLAEGLSGRAVQMDWDMGTASWVQAKHTFSPPVDLSDKDMIGFSLHGGSTGEARHTIAFMVADTNGVFYGRNYWHAENGLNQVDRWMDNVSVPRDAMDFCWGPTQVIDWAHIDRVYCCVKKPWDGGGGGTGQIRIDHVQCDRAADWERQSVFDTVEPDAEAASNAVGYVLSQQNTNGLIVSWKEQPDPPAWLYDQALCLVALSREGEWQPGGTTNDAGEGADALAAFLVAAQKGDGHWARGWDPETAEEISTSGWVGDQAWCVLGLSVYAQRTWNTSAWAAAKAGAVWLADRIDATGKVHNSTEANIDTWWALRSTLRTNDAAVVRDYLMDTNTVWDSEMRYWWGGQGDAAVYPDAQTWASAFARHPSVGETNRALAALTVAARTLRATSDDLNLCGLGHTGPLCVHNEWTAQYAAAGGADAQLLVDVLASQQKPDGAIPGSPDEWGNCTFGWATPWSGLAPTTWFYFALTGQPFPEMFGAVCTGLVAYAGDQDGVVRVVFTNVNDSQETDLTGAGNFALDGLDIGADYWAMAYRDSNNNFSNDPWEASGSYAGNPVALTNTPPAVDIPLADPDIDEDGIADFWEYRYADHPTNFAPSADLDGDGRSNGEEYIADTHPTNGLSCFTNMVIELSSGGVYLIYAGPVTTNTRVYDVYWTTNLAEGAEWVALGLDVPGDDAGDPVLISVTNAGVRAYYRAVAHRP